MLCVTTVVVVLYYSYTAAAVLYSSSSSRSTNTNNRKDCEDLCVVLRTLRCMCTDRQQYIISINKKTAFLFLLQSWCLELYVCPFWHDCCCSVCSSSSGGSWWWWWWWCSSLYTNSVGLPPSNLACCGVRDDVGIDHDLNNNRPNQKSLNEATHGTERLCERYLYHHIHSGRETHVKEGGRLIFIFTTINNSCWTVLTYRQCPLRKKVKIHN